jgi:protein kinase
LLSASDLNPAVATEVSHILEQAMAQNRDQRFASAAEMRKALHRTEQTSTVINRGEAQTVLRPPVAATIASETTRLIDRQPTVAAGETTVVRPLSSGSRRRILPWVLSGGALAVVAACVLGFYVMRRPNEAVVQLDAATQKPSPIASPIATEPIVDPGQNRIPIPAPEPKPTAVQSKTPKRVATPEPQPRKQSTLEPAPATPSSGSEHEAERPENPPDVPRDPTTTPSTIPGRGRNKMRPKGVPSVQVMPGGVVIRKFPDGSQVISTPDGSRVFIGPDGRRQVLNPPQNRRRSPTP